LSELKTTIETFLVTKAGNSDTVRTVETYGRKIGVFSDYLIFKRSLNDDNYELILRSLTSEHIVESIEFYVEKCDIKYKATVDTYFTVVKEYFKFIQTEYGITNDTFNHNHEVAILKDKVEEKINQLKLNITKQCEPLSKIECMQLISKCNEKIDSVSNVQIVQDGYNSDYSFFVSSIIVKLMLYTGIKINILTSLNVADFDIDLNKIKINEYWIHVPDKLALQLKRYIKIRQTILSDNNTCFKLFFNRNNPQKLPGNSKMFEVLNLVVGHKKSLAISKYAIIEMIKANIPSYVIMEFTGYKADVYDHCLEIANQEIAEFKDRDLDAKMRCLDLFDML